MFYAEVKRLDKLPNFEITEILLSDCLPDKLTYPDIQPELYEHTQGWLNLMSSPDELWDVYDADRNLKGRLHKRGEALDEGDYHLTVQVFVRRNDGQFLLTKRSPNKGFAGMWECTGGSAVAAINFIKQGGAKKIKFMCLIAAPEGVKALTEAHPDVDIYIGAQDEKLNEKCYIVPGLGDAGDRLFGTL